jgi:Putative F0F1-ATPase subunit Ca2+/Mg2+ transporter
LKPQANKPYNSILKYTNIAFQMIIIIVAGAWGGKYLDEYLQLKFPAFTLSLTVFSVFAAVYLSIRGLLKK